MPLLVRLLVQKNRLDVASRGQCWLIERFSQSAQVEDGLTHFFFLLFLTPSPLFVHYPSLKKKKKKKLRKMYASSAILI